MRGAKYQIQHFRILHAQFRAAARAGGSSARMLSPPASARVKDPGRRGGRVVGTFARCAVGGAQRRGLANERNLALPTKTTGQLIVADEMPARRARGVGHAEANITYRHTYDKQVSNGESIRSNQTNESGGIFSGHAADGGVVTLSAGGAPFSFDSVSHVTKR